MSTKKEQIRFILWHQGRMKTVTRSETHEQKQRNALCAYQFSSIQTELGASTANIDTKCFLNGSLSLALHHSEIPWVLWKKTQKIINCLKSNASNLEATDLALILQPILCVRIWRKKCSVIISFLFLYENCAITDRNTQFSCINLHITLLIVGSKRIEANHSRNSGRFYAFLYRPIYERRHVQKSNDQVTVNFSFRFDELLDWGVKLWLYHHFNQRSSEKRPKWK